MNDPRNPPPPEAAAPAQPRPASRLPSLLRLGAGLCALATALLLAGPHLRRLPGLLRGDAATAPSPETTLAPTFTPPPASAAPGTVDEQHAALSGGNLLVAESEPEGVEVSVDGRSQGTTPLSVSLECAPGASLTVRFSRRGYEPAEHRTTCRAEGMTRLFTRLKRRR